VEVTTYLSILTLNVSGLNSPHQKTSFDGLSAEFNHIFKEELIPTVLNLFHKIEKEGTPPKSFYETTITFIVRLDKDTPKKRTTGQSS
jgi:hypothetical protein